MNIETPPTCPVADHGPMVLTAQDQYPLLPRPHWWCPKCNRRRDRVETVRMLYVAIIKPFREVARDNGYAIAVHGSLARDVDLLAVAWTDEAVTPSLLVRALWACADRVLGVKTPTLHQRAIRDHCREKPHGRLAWSYYPDPHGQGTYIDLSVLPPGAVIAGTNCPRP